MRFKRFLVKIQRLIRGLWGLKSLWVRALLCWMIGSTFLLNNYQSHFDHRLKIRGPLKDNSNIILILLGKDEVRKFRNDPFDYFKFSDSLLNPDSLTDSFYWDETLWSQLLRKLLKANPEKIGVSFYFGKNLGDVQISPKNKRLFSNKKIIWTSILNTENNSQPPTITYNKNYGALNLKPDIDGIYRHYVLDPNIKLKNLFSPQLTDVKKLNGSYIINFRGDRNSFTTYSLRDFLKQKNHTQNFKGKIILIGAQNAGSHPFPTPFGTMTRVELLANIAHNFKQNNWPVKLPLFFYLLYLALILVVTLMVVFKYPQTLALALLTCLVGILAGFSAWIFDSFNVWVPVLSVIFQCAVTYIIFIGYKLSQNERRSWVLEQERKNLYELEQTKSNFISLISHDLKTPLAKIDGVTEKLIHDPDIAKKSEDIRVIKNSTQELNRYIQSILQVTRVESTDFKLKKDPVDINNIIKRVLNQLTPLAQEKGIKLITHTEPMFSANLDVALIHEVIANLVENAIKYSPEGTTVTISSSEVDEQIIVTVKDEGEGIAQAELSQIWEKFYRAQKHKMATKGTGLGLYLVKYFIELHGGTVFINSKPNAGTEIGFKIPVSTS